jgi:hypothetical protein
MRVMTAGGSLLFVARVSVSVMTNSSSLVEGGGVELFVVGSEGGSVELLVGEGDGGAELLVTAGDGGGVELLVVGGEGVSGDELLGDFCP